MTALLLLLVAGCDGTGAYRAVLRDQINALRETEQILANITDPATMESARVRLEKNHYLFEDIKERAQALPPPSAEVVDRLKEDAPQFQEALNRVQMEVRRVRGLPGGAEFLSKLDTAAGFLRD
jgi:hypothetical protein